MTNKNNQGWKESEADENDVIVHDDIPHPANMKFDEEDNPQ